MRRLGLVACAMLFFVSAVAQAGPGVRRLRLVSGGPVDLARIAHVVIAPDATDEVRASAEDLAFVLNRQFGTEVRVLASHWRFPRDAIYAGNGWQARLSVPIGSVPSPNAFVVSARDRRIFVRGTCDASTSDGMMTFARNYLGARWYWPGDIGYESVDAMPLPRRRWHEPDFLQRTLKLSGNEAEQAFGRRNRLNSVYSFNHNLARIFSKEVWQEHPEAFSVVNGGRIPPSGLLRSDPQPNLASPVAVEIAARAALEFFESNPDADSFSLSINDNVLFDESEETAAVVEPLRYFRGRPVFSDLVFGFANAVARKVFDEAGAWETPSGKPRYLTTLAYYWAEQVPSFQVHPRVMPILTSDRGQWHNPAFREEDKRLIAEWAASGPEMIGTWDYYFGSPYPYPRQMNQWIAKSSRHLSSHGIDVFFAEMYPVWGLDGSKPWFASQLLWDSEADPLALESEFYTNFFGAAARPVRNFYQAAEDRRNRFEGDAHWIKHYQDEAGIELFPPEFCRQLRAHLDEALKAVSGDPMRKQRVGIVSAAFRFTETFSLYHQVRKELTHLSFQVFSGEAVDPQDIAETIQNYRTAESDFEAVVEELRQEQLHARLMSFADRARYDPLPLAASAFFRAGGTVAELELVSAGGIDRGHLESYAGLVRGERDEIPLLMNGLLWHLPPKSESDRFLSPTVPFIPGWDLSTRPAESLFIGPVSNGQAPRGLRVEGSDSVSLSTVIRVQPGGLYNLSFQCGFKVSPDNRSLVRVEFLDEDGRRFRTRDVLRFPTGGGNTSQAASLPVVVPRKGHWVRVIFRASRQYPGDFLQVDSAEFGRVPAGLQAEDSAPDGGPK